MIMKEQIKITTIEQLKELADKNANSYKEAIYDFYMGQYLDFGKAAEKFHEAKIYTDDYDAVRKLAVTLEIDELKDFLAAYECAVENLEAENDLYRIEDNAFNSFNDEVCDYYDIQIKEEDSDELLDLDYISNEYIYRYEYNLDEEIHNVSEIVDVISNILYLKKQLAELSK